MTTTKTNIKQQPGKENLDIATISDLDTLSELLNKKQYSVRHIKGINRSVISFWQDEGLVEDNRAKGQKWRKFSLTTLLWLAIMFELKEFGLGNPKMKKVKEQLFKTINIATGQQLPLIQYGIYQTIVLSKPLFLIIDQKASLQLVNDVDYSKQLRAHQIKSHIVIDFNACIKANIPEHYSKPTFSDTSGLSPEEVEVLDAVRQKDFQSIKITKKNGEIDMIEGMQRLEGQQKIVDLLKQGKYQNIEVKQSNGKVVCIQRTIRKKLK